MDQGRQRAAALRSVTGLAPALLGNTPADETLRHSVQALIALSPHAVVSNQTSNTQYDSMAEQPVTLSIGGMRVGGKGRVMHAAAAARSNSNGARGGAGGRV